MVLTGAAAPIPLRSLTLILPGQTRLRTANRPAQVLIASDRELNSAVFQQPARQQSVSIADLATAIEPLDLYTKPSK